MFGALLGMALLLNLDIVALKLGSHGNRSVVGLYQAGITLANAPYYLASALIPILFTQIKRLSGIRQTLPIVVDTVRLALIVLLPIECLLMVAPATILGALFPAVYRTGATTLRLLALGNSALIPVAILAAVFQATGNAKTAARILLAVTAGEALALTLIVPTWQATGAAATFSAATLTALVVLASAYYVALDRPLVTPALIWSIKYAAALAVGICFTAIVLAHAGSPIVAIGVGGAGYVTIALSAGVLRLPKLHRIPAPQRRMVAIESTN
jgi:O-antigen/teichoic acid export membrane protein